MQANKTSGTIKSYNLFDNTVNTYNLVTNNAGQTDMNSNIENMFAFFEELGDYFEKSTEVTDVIERNLKYRFPVVAYDEYNNVAIVTGLKDGIYEYYKYGTSFYNPTRVIDTYSYLLAISKNAKNITDKVSESESFYENIRFLLPAENTAVAKKCIKNSSNEVIGFNTELQLTNETMEENGTYTNYAKINTSGYEEDTELVAVVSANYTGSLPDVYNTNKLYKVIKYDDLQATISDAWFYNYLFKATNMGIINGIEESNSVNFAANTSLTRAQLITMVLRSASVDVSGYNELSNKDLDSLYYTIMNSGLSNSTLDELGLPNKNTPESDYITKLKDYLSDNDVSWSKNYMNFAYHNGLINGAQYLGLDYFTNSLSVNDGTQKQIGKDMGGCNIKVRRDDAAYIMCQMYVNNILSVNVPLNVYKYSSDISCEKNTYWNNDTAFKDITRLYPYCKDEIYQMYMNGIMIGDTEKCFNPSRILTRAEACTAIIRCMFEIDENIEQVYLEFEGYDNVLKFDTEISKPSTGWESEYNIYAPRSGYYFVKVSGLNLDIENYVLKKRVENADNTISYVDLPDDHTSAYNGEELPDYIIDDMQCVYEGTEYIYKRYYLDEHTGLKLASIGDSVNSIYIQSPQNGDIVFRPNGGGKYIFSNSPETITEDYVADGNGARLWIMNNYGLTQGNYSMTMYHHTNQLTDPVFIDAKFYAEKDTTLVFSKFGYASQLMNGRV